MVITRSASVNTTNTNIVGDVAEASNKGTMKKKRKTTAENSTMKVPEANKKTTKKVNTENAQTSKKSEFGEMKELVGPLTTMDHAANIFLKDFLVQRCWRPKPGERIPPEHLLDEGYAIFVKMNRKEKSKYVKMYKEREAEKKRRYKEYLEERRNSTPPPEASSDTKTLKVVQA